MMVTKRNGDEVAFEKSRIMKAVYDASRATGLAAGTANQIAIDVANEFDHLVQGGTTSIDTIQKIVEEELMSLAPDVARAYIVYREGKDKMRNAIPDATAISDYIFAGKYSRHGETWDECVTRTERMHLNKFPDLEPQIISAFQMVRDKKVLPSMRSLQFGGKAIDDHNARMYNCSFSNLDRYKFWGNAFYLLLCGCGVGYSVQKHHVAMLPQVIKPQGHVWHHLVEDTIQGWATALDELLDSYFTPSLGYIEFNYSGIRPEGSALVTTGGKAPGHLPLKTMLEQVRTLLDSCVGRSMSPFECHRLSCMMAEAVLAGGIRRSSLMCLFSIDDHEMRHCKTGDWMTKYPELAMSNNSVVCDRETVTEQEFTDIFITMKEFGEPGFFLTDDTDVGTNPCGEIGLDPVWHGETGFAFCNLTEINGSLVKTQKELEDCAHVASFIGTLQASYTDFHQLRDCSTKIADRDALLGVSITGICDMDQDLDLPKAAKCVAETNDVTSSAIGIYSAARLTTVKPSGTASLVLGCIGSGIHPHHAKRYLRRVVANPNEPCFQAFYKANPHACQLKENGDFVITFPVEATGLIRHDISTDGFLTMVKHVYQNWVKEGYRTGRPSHNVSATVTVRDGEWPRVASWCWTNRDDLASMSFMAEDGGKVYPHAPRHEVITPADQAEWIELCEKYQPVDYSGISRTDVGSACEGPSCEI